MCKFIEKALINLDSCYDFRSKVFIDNLEEGLYDADLFDEKSSKFHRTNRAERRKATVHKKLRRKAMSSYTDDFIMPTGKVKDSGYRLYEKGDKLYKRSHNYLLLEEENNEDVTPIIGRVTIDDDADELVSSALTYHPNMDEWERYKTLLYSIGVGKMMAVLDILDEIKGISEFIGGYTDEFGRYPLIEDIIDAACEIK